VNNEELPRYPSLAIFTRKTAVDGMAPGPSGTQPPALKALLQAELDIKEETPVRLFRLAAGRCSSYCFKPDILWKGPYS
jgi:hypothetical protein